MARTLFFRMVLRKFSEITYNKPIFSQYNIFYDHEYFFFHLFSIIAKVANQIRNNVVCVVLALFLCFTVHSLRAVAMLFNVFS